MDHIIDLRSDTVTQPTQAMRQVMASAQVGDDVAGDDPTVNALEARAATLFGKDAALFVPSGTMGNLLAILAQTRPGDEILTHNESHIYYYEGGGYAALAGCSVRFVDDADAPKKGTMTPEALELAMRGHDLHYPHSTLFTIENTHNRAGGLVWPETTRRALCDRAHQAGLRVHMDGARLWNASVASGNTLDQLAKGCDSISVCLSKGLGCPVGSLLVADQATIDIARHKRKMLGGGMRQAGVLAAAAIYALDHHIDRLADDHRRAAELGRQLAAMPMFDFDPEQIETNLVYATLSTKAIDAHGDAFAWQDRVESVGVRCYAESRTTLRFVTHLDLGDDQVAEVPERLHSLLG
ncbi:MAG: threonine aldolase family protein [Phycisphaerales bacterium JB052]